MERKTTLVNSNIDIGELQPGDHIYAYRALFTYAHHGIFVGKKRVIHYNPTQSNDTTTYTCKNCGFKTNVHVGVIKSCIHYFLYEDSSLSDTSLHRVQYNVPLSLHFLKRPGSCSTCASKPPHEVVATAKSLLYGFGEYSLFGNNCESFATYCKIGKPKSEQVTGLSSIIIGAVTGVAAFSFVQLLMNNIAEKKKIDLPETSSTKRSATDSDDSESD